MIRRLRHAAALPEFFHRVVKQRLPMRLRRQRLPRARGLALGLRLRATHRRQLRFVESMQRRRLRIAPQGHDLAKVADVARTTRGVVGHHQRLDIERVAVGHRHFAAIDHQPDAHFREEPHGVAVQRDFLGRIGALPLRQHIFFFEYESTRLHRRQATGDHRPAGIHALQPVGLTARDAAAELLVQRC